MSATRNSLVQQIEDLEDEQDDYAAMLARVEAANEERIPLEVVRRLSNCEPPIRVWREYRGLSVNELAAASGVPILPLQLMDIGEFEGASLRDYAAVARALGIDLDMLVRWTPDGEPGSE